MNESYPRITVYGATGHTGRLVCRELARRGRDFVAGGRNLERLQRISSMVGEEYGVVPTLRQGSVEDWASMSSMLESTNVLINCAGPFADLGPPVARAAVRHDVHYLDTTGEQEYIRWLEEELAVEARRRQLVLMPACAFEYATGSLAAALAIEQGASEIVVSYGVSGFSTSAGTKQSVVRSIAADGVTFVGGERVPCRSAEKLYRVPTPDGGSHSGVWFPGGEPIFVPELGEVDRAESCLRTGATAAKILTSMSGVLSSVAGLVRPAADRLIGWLHDEDRRGRADETDAPYQVVAFDPAEDRWWAELSGHEPYLTTSRLIVEAASRIDDRRKGAVGLQSPPALFEAREFAESVGINVRTRR